MAYLLNVGNDGSRQFLSCFVGFVLCLNCDVMSYWFFKLWLFLSWRCVFWLWIFIIFTSLVWVPRLSFCGLTTTTRQLCYVLCKITSDIFMQKVLSAVFFPSQLVDINIFFELKARVALFSCLRIKPEYYEMISSVLFR